MGAGHEVIEWLTFGIPLHWKAGVDFPSMSAKNNASALKNKQFVSKQLKEWLEIGALSIVPRSKAKIISPISVDTKWDGIKQQRKFRVCFDGSRMTSNLVYHSVKLPDIRHISTYLQPQDEIATVDMTNVSSPHFSTNAIFESTSPS